MDKLASIIIPVYNVEPYLRECLDSVVSQHYKNLEILVVDDCSTDNSGLICDSYRVDPRIRVFHQPNGGPSVARNTALAHANGEYIFFVDADDFIHPDMVSKAVACMEENNADMVIFGHIETHKDGREEIKLPASVGLSTVEIQKKLITDRMENYPCNKAFRSYLWKHRQFPPGIRFEDVATIPHIAKAATKIVTLNEPLYYYRIHKTSYLHKKKYNLPLDYSLIKALKSLEPLALSTDDPLTIVQLRGKILNNATKVLMMNYYLNELCAEEALSLAEYIKKDWDDAVLHQLDCYISFLRWLIVHAPLLARCYGKYRYQWKCRNEE